MSARIGFVLSEALSEQLVELTVGTGMSAYEIAEALIGSMYLNFKSNLTKETP